jgi:hypothetical protein
VPTKKVTQPPPNTDRERELVARITDEYVTHTPVDQLKRDFTQLTSSVFMQLAPARHRAAAARLLWGIKQQSSKHGTGTWGKHLRVLGVPRATADRWISDYVVNPTLSPEKKPKLQPPDALVQQSPIEHAMKIARRLLKKENDIEEFFTNLQIVCAAVPSMVRDQVPRYLELTETSERLAKDIQDMCFRLLELTEWLHHWLGKHHPGQWPDSPPTPPPPPVQKSLPQSEANPKHKKEAA